MSNNIRIEEDLLKCETPAEAYYMFTLPRAIENFTLAITNQRHP